METREGPTPNSDLDWPKENTQTIDKAFVVDVLFSQPGIRGWSSTKVSIRVESEKRVRSYNSYRPNNFIQRFEDTGIFQDRLRSGTPRLSEVRIFCEVSQMTTLMEQSTTGVQVPVCCRWDFARNTSTTGNIGISHPSLCVAIVPLQFQHSL